MVFAPALNRFFTLTVMTLGLSLWAGCNVAEPSTSANSVRANAASDKFLAINSEPKGATIPIEPNGPADTVRVFYKHLRDNKIREALHLTNMRLAIEGLTDGELNEFAIDFSHVASLVPEVIEINGEIVTNNKATVTAVLPSTDSDESELQKINLRKDGDVWVILSADETTEARIKKEGKNYFYSLKIDVKQEEARQMLERISKAELAHSVQNAGLYAEMQTLVTAGLLPPDIKTSESTGYNYILSLSADKKTYFATATPAVYGKTGKLSFRLEPDPKGLSRITSNDLGGKPIR
ncbi:MAG: hypothetical protein WKF34_01070 [Pyrinomonadaceae bacterium]